MLLHIGFHKTGTTWTQRRLFDKTAPFLTVASHEEVNTHIFGPHDLDFDASKAADAFKKAISSDSEEIPVISAEILCGSPFTGGRDSTRTAERLKEVFPDAKILITVREQVSMLGSAYKQYVASGGTGTAHQFFNPPMTYSYNFFSPVHFCYDRLVQFYRGLFGEKNVCVLPFEVLQTDPESFCNRIVSFASEGRVRSVQTPAPDAIGSSNSDISLWLVRNINRIRRTQSHPYPAFEVPSVGNFARRITLWADRKLIGSSNRQSLQRYIQNQFQGYYSESNKVLQTYLDDDLSALGYEMPENSGTELAE